MIAQLPTKFESTKRKTMNAAMMSYQELLKTPKWETKRVSILIRDDYRCRHCGQKNGLQVHHRQYHINKFGDKLKPWDYADRYLITLCNECHHKGHELYKVPVFKLIKK